MPNLLSPVELRYYIKNGVIYLIEMHNYVIAVFDYYNIVIKNVLYCIKFTEWFFFRILLTFAVRAIKVR